MVLTLQPVHAASAFMTGVAEFARLVGSACVKASWLSIAATVPPNLTTNPADG